MRTNSHTCSCCWICEVTTCACSLAFVAVERIGKKRRWAIFHTCTILIRICAMWACTNTFVCYIIDKIVWHARSNTSPIVRHILNIVSIRTNINTHFNIWISVRKHLPTSSIIRAVFNTFPIYRISIFIVWAICSFYTMIYIVSQIDESVIRTCCNTFILDICESVICEVIGWASCNAFSCCVKSIWSWGTKL